jgi:hypothetical protein
MAALCWWDKHDKNRAVVHFEKRFVSGHRFGDANKGSGTSGFSRWGSPTAQRLKPVSNRTGPACLKACPDTNLFFQSGLLPRKA